VDDGPSAVGGERDAELDGVGAGIGKPQDELLGEAEARVAGGDVGDEGRPAGARKGAAKVARCLFSSAHFHSDAEILRFAQDDKLTLQMFGEDVHIFVAAAGEVEDDDLAALHSGGALHQLGQSVAGSSGDDAFR
jgi:hypothetical protein